VDTSRILLTIALLIPLQTFSQTATPDPTVEAQDKTILNHKAYMLNKYKKDQPQTEEQNQI
jgi:hypothetical protein